MKGEMLASSINWREKFLDILINSHSSRQPWTEIYSPSPPLPPLSFPFDPFPFLPLQTRTRALVNPVTEGI